MTNKDEGRGVECRNEAIAGLGIGRTPAAGAANDGGRLKLHEQSDLTEVGTIMLKHENLADNPKLMVEWDYEKNGDLRPGDFTSDSKRYVWWKCAYGHSWQARISDRINGSCCPYDCGKRMPGFTPLASVRPDLAAEWDHERNDYLSPQDISAYSQIKVKWRCSKGHRWQATVSSRHWVGGCPLCLKERLNDGQ